MSFQEELEEWSRYTNTLVLETEAFNASFRRVHRCQCADRVDYSPGVWVCGAMKRAQRKNKELQRLWTENLRRSPMLNESELLRKVAYSINP